jgi:hypothetical protein
LMIVRRGKPIWTKEKFREPGPPAADEIVELFSGAALRRLPAPLLNVAVGPHASQVKVLRNLPPVDDINVLAGLVRENVGAFFVKKNGSLATAGIHVDSSGQKWSAVWISAASHRRRSCYRWLFALSGSTGRMGQ